MPETYVVEPVEMLIQHESSQELEFKELGDLYNLAAVKGRCAGSNECLVTSKRGPLGGCRALLHERRLWPAV